MKCSKIKHVLKHCPETSLSLDRGKEEALWNRQYFSLLHPLVPLLSGVLHPTGLPLPPPCRRAHLRPGTPHHISQKDPCVPPWSPHLSSGCVHVLIIAQIRHFFVFPRELERDTAGREASVLQSCSLVVGTLWTLRGAHLHVWTILCITIFSYITPFK